MAEGDRQARRRRVQDIARTQGGYFTTAQALAAGYPYQAQTYHVDRGNWQRVDRGLFRFPEWPVSEHEDLIRWTQWSGARGIVSHETALSVHDLGDVNPAQVHLTVPLGFRKRGDGVVLHHGEVPEDDIQQREGFRITTPLRSVLDVATGDLDLDQFAVVVDEAFQRGLFTRRMLLARVDSFGDRAALRTERALSRQS